MGKLEPTKYKERNISADTSTSLLAHGRYGTREMIEIFGPEKTFQYCLRVQAEAVKVLSDLHPEIVPHEYAEEIASNANLDVIDPRRIRELEAEKGHDVVAINSALEEKVSKEAAVHINKARTSADTTETAKALQCKEALEVYIDSVENLRDIILEKAMSWVTPHMDTTHLLDALPTLAGRPFMFYAEMLESDLDYLVFVCKNSVKGKWSDATGNHHSATTLGINGMKLQAEHCRRLGIGFMDASAQIPGREFLVDVVYGLARVSATMSNLASYIRMGKGDDVNIFIDMSPKRRKGSSAMPHKDVKGGNPIVEEQTGSLFNFMIGALATLLSSTQFDYARDLTGSASDRIVLDDVFKFTDHVTRELAKTIYYLELNKERVIERVHRSLGIVTSEQVMTYLTDQRRTSKPMPRKEAHDLVAALAAQAYSRNTLFREVLVNNQQIRERFSDEIIAKITNPEEYVGQSREIMEAVFRKYHRRKSLIQ